MKRTISGVLLLAVIIAVLILHGCGGGSDMGEIVRNDIPTSGVLSALQKTSPGATKGAGAVRGAVHKKLLSDISCTGGNAVYIFEGPDAVPDDIDRIAAEPVDYVIVKFDSVSGQYQYRITGLDAGDYTLAFTCQAGADNPDTDNYITFSGVRPVTVLSGEEVIKNLFRSAI